MSSSAARVVMSLAESIAPPARAEWSAAMRAEFEALAGGAGSLNWAMGCLVSATGWRVQPEAGWVLTTALGCCVSYLIQAQMFMVFVSCAQGNSFAWYYAMQTLQAGLLFVLCFALVAVWPRRAWLVGGVVPMIQFMGWPLTGFVETLRASLNSPFLIMDMDPAIPFVAFPFWWLAQETWGGVLGAIVGWALWRLTRGRAPRSSATTSSH